MIRRTTKVQLVLFVLITLLGVSYVSANYVGLTQEIFNDGCTVHADFSDSGGIFTGAEATYRGVTVGKVGTLHLLAPGKDPHLPKGGIRADVELDSCSSPRIPADTTANIANRSVVGEQYINFVPPTGTPNDGPKLAANTIIEANRTTIPTPTITLLENLDGFVNSVPLNALQTTVSELYNAVSGRGPALGSILDSTNSLLKTATQSDNLSATLNLIRDSATVLQTQLDVSDPLKSWTHSLNLLSQQLKSSDPDIRRLLDDGPGDLNVVTSFIQNNRTDLGLTLSNLITVNNLITTHIAGVNQIFELYPALAAGGQGVLQDRRGALAQVLQSSPMPQDCGDPFKGGQGYDGVKRTPDVITPIAPNVAARCTAPVSSGVNIRGSANVPGGDPISLSGGGYAYPRVDTSNTLAKMMQKGPVQIGPANTGTSSVLSDSRYDDLLVDALR